MIMPNELMVPRYKILVLVQAINDVNKYLHDADCYKPMPGEEPRKELSHDCLEMLEHYRTELIDALVAELLTANRDDCLDGE